MLMQPKNNKSTIFIFEGIDHVGKTTIINLVKKCLEEKYGLSCAVISFPGKEKNTLGSLVYDIHHNREKYFNYDINNISIQLLHVASHIDNIITKVLPSIEDGKIILLDRFWWSTLAYGLGNNIPRNLLEEIIKPELYYWNNIKIDGYFLIERKNCNLDYPPEVTNTIYNTYKELVENTYNAYKIVNNGALENTTQLILSYIINGNEELL
ncbi:dTMP kinase [Thomasclavelia cocleata]|uniref:dTMP kinase n=1 Tax=Thomasclavelia cocleata TaxID=69824 RepID=UPI0024305FBD|nr:hypothetical protein [Thomasclavelia cocleata]